MSKKINTNAATKGGLLVVCGWQEVRVRADENELTQYRWCDLIGKMLLMSCGVSVDKISHGGLECEQYFVKSKSTEELVFEL